MRYFRTLFLVAASLPITLGAQGASVKKTVAKIADTTATAAAAGAVDSALAGNRLTAAMAGMGGMGSICVVKDPATGAILRTMAMPSPSAGSAVVAAAKKAASGKKDSTETTPGGCPPGSSPATQADMMNMGPMGNQPGAGAGAMDPTMAGMMGGGAPEGAGAGLGATAGAMAGAAAAASPLGMAAAAAPAAGAAAAGAARGVGRLLGRGPMSERDMATGLARGRLELRGVKFLPGSDEMEDGFEPVFHQLAEVLKGYKQKYALWVAPEADKDIEPDEDLARNRAEKAFARLLAAGIPDGVVEVGGALPKEKLAGGKYPKLGQAKLELIRVPKEP